MDDAQQQLPNAVWPFLAFMAFMLVVRYLYIRLARTGLTRYARSRMYLLCPLSIVDKQISDYDFFLFHMTQ
jgi:hypothetical protein